MSMNAEPDEHFIELALKAATARATAAERAELHSLVAARPELQAEFERVQADARLASELLPLLAAAEAKPGKLLGYARERLQTAVRKQLGTRKAAPSPFLSVRQWLLGLAAVAAAGVVIVQLPEPLALVPRAAGLTDSVTTGVVFRKLPELSELPVVSTWNVGKAAPLPPLIQLAMLDSLGLKSGVLGAASGVETANGAGFLQTLPAMLGQSMGQTTFTAFSKTADLKRWLEDWPADKRQPAFKVWFDRDAAEARVLGRWDGEVRIYKSLPAALKEVQTMIAQALTDRTQKSPPRQQKARP